MAEKYVCGYCGAEYGTPVERAKCEFQCDEKQKQEIERQRIEQRDKEQRGRTREVNQAYSKLVELCKAYSEDYGPTVFHSTEDGRRYLPFNSFLDLLFLP